MVPLSSGPYARINVFFAPPGTATALSTSFTNRVPPPQKKTLNLNLYLSPTEQPYLTVGCSCLRTVAPTLMQKRRQKTKVKTSPKLKPRQKRKSRPKQDRLKKPSAPSLLPSLAPPFSSFSILYSLWCVTSLASSLYIYLRKEKKKIGVVLTDDVEGLGVKGEDMPVSKGYARNFLFPKKLAVYKTEENLKLYEADRAVLFILLPLSPSLCVCSL